MKNKQCFDDKIKNDKPCRKCISTWNKGKSTATDPRIKPSKTTFMNGHIPWNKGLTMEDPRLSYMSNQRGVDYETRYGKVRSFIIKNKIKEKRKLQTNIGTYIRTDEHKNKLRLVMRINNPLKNGRFHPAYNKYACKVFNLINLIFDMNGRHALNNPEGEFRISRYFVDYYDVNHNLVIEWDEPYHMKPEQAKLDKNRQEVIQNLLNCKFLRISQKEFMKMTEESKIVELANLILPLIPGRTGDYYEQRLAVEKTVLCKNFKEAALMLLD